MRFSEFLQENGDLMKIGLHQVDRKTFNSVATMIRNGSPQESAKVLAIELKIPKTEAWELIQKYFDPLTGELKEGQQPEAAVKSSDKLSGFSGRQGDLQSITSTSSSR